MLPSPSMQRTVPFPRESNQGAVMAHYTTIARPIF
jgi:hypothetical protein